MHSQTLYALSELLAMVFGLKEFKQLLLTIYEIAIANSISAEQAVSWSLKVVEEQHNDKPGYEGKINEKRNELSQLNNQILWSTDTAGHPFLRYSITQSFRNGASEQEIVGIKQLIQDHANHALPWFPNHEEKNSQVKGNKEGNLSKWEP